MCVCLCVFMCVFFCVFMCMFCVCVYLCACVCVYASTSSLFHSASRVSLNNMEQGCGILPTTPCFHPPTLPSRPHKSVIAHATTHQPTALPPLTPQPHHPSPRPVDTVQSPLIPDHAVGQPTPPPASVMYDLLTQMLWTLGAYPSSSSGYSRVLAQRPHEVLRGRGRPRRCPAPSGIVATTTLTVPQRAAVHQSGSDGAPSPASCCPAQLRYPYGNPVLPRLPSRQYPPNGESGSLSMEPMGYKGQRLNADDLLHVSSYPSTPREPRVVDLALGGGWSRAVLCSWSSGQHDQDPRLP